MAAQSESPAEEIKRLRRCINDLISVLALSSTWTGGEPWRIIGNLMEALLSMLSLDLVYVRLRGETNTAPAEMARFSPSWARQPDPQEIGERLKTWLDSGSPESPLHPSDFFGVGEIALVPLQLGLQGEMGIIFAGSRRVDFPQQTEKLILNVAANEAAIWLRGASLLSEQRRVSSELDRRVAQRTADLDASNDELQREITERKGAEERLRREETELKRSQAHKAAILDSSLDCIVAVDHEGCITEFNPAAERVLGYRREDVLGKLVTLPLANRGYWVNASK
jgi:PAS domain-containing protein